MSRELPLNPINERSAWVEHSLEVPLVREADPDSIAVARSHVYRWFKTIEGLRDGITSFFSSSACVCAAEKQTNVNTSRRIRRVSRDARRRPRRGKLFSERMCRHFREDFGLETRVARYHDVYGGDATNSTRLRACAEGTATTRLLHGVSGGRLRSGSKMG